MLNFKESSEFSIRENVAIYWPVMLREFRRVLCIPDVARRLTIRVQDLHEINEQVEHYLSQNLETRKTLDVKLIALKNLQRYAELIRDNLNELIRIEERDATVRALKWLRKWRETHGIDLLQDDAYDTLREKGLATYGVPLIRREKPLEESTTCEEETSLFQELVK